MKPFLVTTLILMMGGCAHKPPASPPSLGIAPLVAPEVSLEPPDRIIYGGGFNHNPEPQISIAVLQSEQEVDAPPVAKMPTGVVLVYPREMVRAGLTGVATVRILIEKDGSVSDVWPVSASQREFSDAVVARILKYTFQPAQRGGKPVSSFTLCKVTFSFRGD